MTENMKLQNLQLQINYEIYTLPRQGQSLRLHLIYRLQSLCIYTLIITVFY